MNPLRTALSVGLYASMASVLLSAPVMAQDAEVHPNYVRPDVEAATTGGNWNFGTGPCPGGTTDIVDLQAQTGNNGHLGIQYVASEGTYWSSSRGMGGLPPHKLYQFDAAGVLIGEVDQFPTTSSSAWGTTSMRASPHRMTSPSLSPAPPQSSAWSLFPQADAPDPRATAASRAIHDARPGDAERWDRSDTITILHRAYVGYHEPRTGYLRVADRLPDPGSPSSAAAGVVRRPPVSLRRPLRQGLPRQRR